MSSTDAPAGDVQDNSYVNRPGQNEYNVPVVKDDTAAAATEEEGGYTDESTADSDAQLAKDDLDIDKTNILESRTRGAAKDQGSYTEPGDEEGLPGPDEDGTSRGRQQ
ncbi:hypothetical protein SMMN14_06279 [Sphaerulina musiva]